MFLKSEIEILIRFKKRIETNFIFNLIISEAKCSLEQSQFSNKTESYFKFLIIINFGDLEFL
jgi:hypothetical protein